MIFWHWHTACTILHTQTLLKTPFHLFPSKPLPTTSLHSGSLVLTSTYKWEQCYYFIFLCLVFSFSIMSFSICYKWKDFILHCNWILFHCYIPYFFYSLNSRWTQLSPFFNYVNSALIKVRGGISLTWWCCCLWPNSEV